MKSLLKFLIPIIVRLVMCLFLALHMCIAIPEELPDQRLLYGCGERVGKDGRLYDQYLAGSRKSILKEVITCKLQEARHIAELLCIKL